MLATDGDFISTSDLTTLDVEVPDVASAENITLDDPVTGNGIIHRAIEEAGDEIMKYMKLFGGYLSGNGSVSANHQAAVMNTGLPGVNRSKILKGQIVVTDCTRNSWTAIKRWVAYKALTVFYRDAANRTVKERYRDKEERYAKLASGPLWDAISALGVPVVRMPLPCPGATWEPNTGVWSADNATLTAGSGTQAASFDFAITWVDTTPGYYVSPASNGNAESHPSATQSVMLSAGNVLRISIASLVPPNGCQHPSTQSLAVVAYHKATGWNVYVGLTGGPLYLQNATPIAIAQQTYTLAGDPVTNTSTAGLGQYADLYLTLQKGLLDRA